MAIVSMLMFEIPQEDVEEALKQIAGAKEMAMSLGANDLRVGQVQTGQYTGNWLVTSWFDNMEAFGKMNDAMTASPEFQAMMANAKGELVSRTLIRTVDI